MFNFSKFFFENDFSLVPGTPRMHISRFPFTSFLALILVLYFPSTWLPPVYFISCSYWCMSQYALSLFYMYRHACLFTSFPYSPRHRHVTSGLITRFMPVACFTVNISNISISAQAQSVSPTE